MSSLPQLELTRPAVPWCSVSDIEDPRGLGGRTTVYRSPSGDSEARLTILAKLPTVAIDERQGYLATSDFDAAVAAIGILFDLMSSRLPRSQWKPDLHRYCDDHQQLTTWATSTIEVNGVQQSAVSLQYSDAAVHLADLGDSYLLVATTPAIDIPQVQQTAGTRA